MNDPRRVFEGAKVMLFLGDRLVILKRDNKPQISWPGYLDFPGGAREGHESPETCAIRETREEVGLRLAPSHLVLAHVRQVGGCVGWYYAAHMPAAWEQDIVFGDEGEGWLMMTPEAYAAHPRAIPHFRDILMAYLAGKGPDASG